MQCAMACDIIVRSLVAPYSCHHFVSEYWERQHLVVRESSAARRAAASAGFDALLRSRDLSVAADHWNFKVAHDHAQVRMLEPNSFSHNNHWKDGSRVDGAVIASARRRNHTVVLHNLELYWRPIGRISLALQRYFGLYAQANVYYSPAGLSAAVHPHQDAQSVFVLQLEGSKRWELFQPPQRWRLRMNQRGKGGDVAPPEELTSPVDGVNLSPGDVVRKRLRIALARPRADAKADMPVPMRDAMPRPRSSSSPAGFTTAPPRRTQPRLRFT